MPGEAVRLVVFPSLDPVQLSSVVDELQPSYIHFLHGMPPRSELAWRHDTIRTMNLQTCSESKNDSEVSVSTLDYRETIGALLEIYQQHSTFDRIVVSPMGSKMQSLGVGLVRAVLPDIQIVYPTPHKFTTPESYTMGTEESLQPRSTARRIEIAFGCLTFTSPQIMHNFLTLSIGTCGNLGYLT